MMSSMYDIEYKIPTIVILIYNWKPPHICRACVCSSCVATQELIIRLNPGITHTHVHPLLLLLQKYAYIYIYIFHFYLSKNVSLLHWGLTPKIFPLFFRQPFTSSSNAPRYILHSLQNVTKKSCWPARKMLDKSPMKSRKEIYQPMNIMKSAKFKVRGIIF